MSRITTLLILIHCISSSLALWATDSYAMDFGDNATFGAYNCGTPLQYNFQYEFTFEAWIKHRWPTGRPITDPTDFSEIFCKTFPTWEFPRHKIVTFGRSFQTNQLLLTFNYLDSGGGINEVDKTSAGSVPYDTWTHVAVTFNAKIGVINFFINGTLDTGYHLDVDIVQLYQNATQPFLIGGPLIIDDEYFVGVMDELRIWNVERTSSEIADSMDCHLNGDEPGLIGYYTFANGNTSLVKDYGPYGLDCYHVNSVANKVLVSPSKPSSNACVVPSTSITPSSSTSGSLSSSTGTTSVVTTSTTSNNGTEPVDNSSFSPASTNSITIIAIIVSVIGFCLLMSIALAIILYRKRKATKPQVSVELKQTNYSNLSSNSIVSTEYSSLRGTMETAPSKPSQDSQKLPVLYSEINFQKEIGAGSFGKVFLGEWQMIQVAIKVCVTVTNDFLSEAKLMTELRPHPNVLTIFGVSTDGPYPAMILEYCKNGSLDRWVYSSQEFPIEEKLRIIKGTALGMLHLHKNGVVHRDLAARNILLTENNSPKIADFGLSRFVDEVTQTSSNILPLRWMSPESLQTKCFSRKSDVWSWAVMVSEILNREKPFEGMDILTAGTSIRDRGIHPEIKVEIPKYLKDLLGKCWEIEPDKRPSFEEICILLK